MGKSISESTEYRVMQLLGFLIEFDIAENTRFRKEVFALGVAFSSPNEDSDIECRFQLVRRCFNILRSFTQRRNTCRQVSASNL